MKKGIKFVDGCVLPQNFKPIYSYTDWGNSSRVIVGTEDFKSMYRFFFHFKKINDTIKIESVAKMYELVGFYSELTFYK